MIHAAIFLLGVIQVVATIAALALLAQLFQHLTEGGIK